MRTRLFVGALGIVISSWLWAQDIEIEYQRVAIKDLASHILSQFNSYRSLPGHLPVEQAQGIKNVIRQDLLQSIQESLEEQVVGTTSVAACQFNRLVVLASLSRAWAFPNLGTLITPAEIDDFVYLPKEQLELLAQDLADTKQLVQQCQRHCSYRKLAKQLLTKACS